MGRSVATATHLNVVLGIEPTGKKLPQPFGTYTFSMKTV